MSETVRVACPHDCPDTCAMLVTVDDGVATKIKGDPSAPFTDGTLCTKVSHYLERTYSPDRLRYPMKRAGKKGEGKFRRISWDEALAEIAARLEALAADNPESILPCNYAGTMGMVQYSSIATMWRATPSATRRWKSACSRNIRRSASPSCVASAPLRWCSSRANTAPPSQRRSVSTTACSATPAAASPRAPSPACRR